MKKYILSFVRRGLIAFGFGPVVWAIVYAVLNACGVVDQISVGKMVTEILSVALLAFIAGGISTVYEIERMPTVGAIFIHALVLYADYIVIYLMNGWLTSGVGAIITFTACFAVGFAVIWLVIYLATKKSADTINKKLDDMQSGSESA